MPATRLSRPLRALLCAPLLLLAALPALPAGAATYPGDPVVGPSPAVRSLGGIDIAPDGTGAMAAVVQDGGIDHVVVSRLLGGGWTAPERVDGALPGASSQPVVSAANGGRVTVAFVNGGNVFAITRPGAAAGYSALQTIWGGGGASDPSLDLSVNRKGYLVFTAPGAGGHDVRVAFSKDGAPWQLIAAPLDHDANADAGSGSNRPRVGTSADGTAVVAWGEAGHVYTRRVQGLRPSVLSTDANAGLVIEGVQAASVDQPEVGVQDDDSFTGIAMRAQFAVGGVLRSRVVYRRLRGSRFEQPVNVDATPFASGQGSSSPQIATGGIGQGIVLGSADASFLSYAMLLRADATPGPVQQVDSVTAPTAPTYAVPVVATPLKQLVAWQLGAPATSPAAGGSAAAGAAAEIRSRFYDGTQFVPETVMSRPDLGPTNAALGLATASDDSGNIAVAYAQDVPGRGRAISVAVIDQPPGRFAPHWGAAWQRTATPLLTWSRSLELWGLYYKVTIDGQDAGYGDDVHLQKRVRTPLAQGVHRWQVSAFDRRGQSFVAKLATVRVDSVAPTATATVSGVQRAGSALQLAVSSADATPPPPAGQQPVATAGVGAVLVDWGDGTRETIKRGARHAYAAAGSYRLRVVVTDRAGNRTVVRQALKIKPKPNQKSTKKKRATTPAGGAALLIARR
ncbi:MAG: hypothetical protein JWQ48_1891 [Conexibacter sp.]|nr:hypothetical protein [Conexibacter sp.]